MQRRKSVAVAVLCLGLLLAGVLAVVLFASGTRIDQQHFETLHEGMTRAETERVLGGQPRNECRATVFVWLPREGNLLSAQLDPGETVRVFPDTDPPEDGHEAVWVSEEGLIAARFGDDGRLREKHFSTVQGTGRPTAMDFVRHVLGQ